MPYGPVTMGILDRFRLDDRVAVITGASSGLGAVFATALAEAGADVVLGARRTEKLEDTRRPSRRSVAAWSPWAPTSPSPRTAARWWTPG